MSYIQNWWKIPLVSRWKYAFRWWSHSLQTNKLVNHVCITPSNFDNIQQKFKHYSRLQHYVLLMVMELCYFDSLYQPKHMNTFFLAHSQPFLVEALLLNLFFNLNCPCHLYRSIYRRMHNWAPRRLVYSKVYFDMENLFLF